MATTPTSSMDSSFPAAPSTTISHIVLFKYRADISWTDLEAHFSAFLALQTQCLNSSGKPYMLSMRMGKNRSRETLNKGMTHGFILEFASQDDLDYYLSTDPVHAAFSRAALPMVEDSVVLDILPGKLFGTFPPAPPTTKTTHTGTCHCGSLHFTAALPTYPTPAHILCHCRTCQLLSGAPYTCNAIIPRGDLQITRGSPAEYAYTGASGKKVRCFFCRDCTSHVYHLQEVNPDVVVVRTLLLERGAELNAGGEIFGEGRLGWVKELKDALGE